MKENKKYHHLPAVSGGRWKVTRSANHQKWWCAASSQVSMKEKEPETDSQLFDALRNMAWFSFEVRL